MNRPAESKELNSVAKNTRATVKKGLQLDRVVLLGRTLEEYREYFALDLQGLQGKKVLDVASGVSSFTAEANALGIDVTACDPIYNLDPDFISTQSEQDLELVTNGVRNLDTYNWDWYKSPERLGEFRRKAKNQLVEDFRRQVTGRYIEGKLPGLPFSERHFDLTLVSYFLLVYQENFDYEFHRAALLELLRVTRGEVRVYPVVTFEAVRSDYIERLQNDAIFADCKFELVKTDFEFLRNSNYYLSVVR